MQFVLALTELGFEVPQRIMQQIFDTLDADQSWRISFAELRAWLSSREPKAEAASPAALRPSEVAPGPTPSPVRVGSTSETTPKRSTSSSKVVGSKSASATPTRSATVRAARVSANESRQGHRGTPKSTSAGAAYRSPQTAERGRREERVPSRNGRPSPVGSIGGLLL